MDKLLRSALFIPANNPGMIQSSELLDADALIYDLEDAISLNQKDAARDLLKEGFAFFKREQSIRIVRVNPYDSPFFLDDVALVKTLDIDYILLAKADTTSVKILADSIRDTNIEIIALIESASSLFYLADILQADPKVAGMLFGAEDYSLDMGIERTKQSDEILVARQTIATTCKALNKFSIDTPFTDVDDFEGLKNDAFKAKNWGLEAKACINPRQVPYVNEVFSPTMEEIVYAQEVIYAAQEAEAAGLGVFSLHGKMVDAPIINRAKLTLDNARKAGIKYE